MSPCPKLDSCRFFVKHCNEIPEASRALVELYCRGRLQGQCKRLLFFAEHGVRPSDDMMPNGDSLLD